MKQSQWVVVLRETKLSSVMTRQVAEAISLHHDTRADGTLDYASLCDDIFDGDFDHFANKQHFVYKVGGRKGPGVGELSRRSTADSEAGACCDCVPVSRVLCPPPYPPFGAIPPGEARRSHALEFRWSCRWIG